MNDYESDYSIIMELMKNTGQQSIKQFKINNLFSIKRKQEHQVFNQKNFDKDPLRLLLFHGTAHQNLLGILDCGMKISPMGIN